jgi:hypothetical protein
MSSRSKTLFSRPVRKRFGPDELIKSSKDSYHRRLETPRDIIQAGLDLAILRMAKIPKTTNDATTPRNFLE